MADKNIAGDRWDENDPTKKNGKVEKNKDPEKNDPLKPEAATETDPKPQKASFSDVMKRRGFFEAISEINCPMKKLAIILGEYKAEAERRIALVDTEATVHIDYLNRLIIAAEDRIKEIDEKLKEFASYKTSEDSELQLLIANQKEEEARLNVLQDKLTGIRVKMGLLKSSIIDKSLEEAEAQVKKALAIETTIYNETKELNQKRFDDEKDFLARLADHYQAVYNRYEARYKKTEKQLNILDADGISPVTTKVLSAIGSTSFIAAGFFFSVFVGAAGLGTQDIISMVFGGLIDISKDPMHILFKILFLLGLILLVTGVSWLCNKLLNRLKRSSTEEIFAETNLDAATVKELREFEYQISIKSNNWYAFWLQLIPGVLIAGLVLLAISASNTVDPDIINLINTSSEGLIIGSITAMSVAGMIYLYIIKIVEPRLLKKYDASASTDINWLKANRELVGVIITFLILCGCVIAFPHLNNIKGLNIIPATYKTRYSLLLFIGLCLVGGTSFAYGIRSQGLITTGKFLEMVMLHFNKLIAYCSGPQSPKMFDGSATDHSLIVKQVLTQFAFKTTIVSKPVNNEKQSIVQQMAGWLSELFSRSKETENSPTEANARSTTLEPWEEQHFPHIVEELKAVESEYSLQKIRSRKAGDEVSDHKLAKNTEKKNYQTEKETCKKNIKEYYDQAKATRDKKPEQCHQIWFEHNAMVSDFCDGFDLGMWYRENGIGPTLHFFESCNPPANPVLLLNNK